MVAHKEGKTDIPCKLIPNVGLEFGCYNHYLMHKWTGGDTFFTHDDNSITKEALKEIEGIKFDQCFLFSTEDECNANGKVHGRAFFCSDKLLNRIKADGGFWYDEGNKGSIPATSAESPNYHNSGILMFKAYLESVCKEFSVSQLAVIPGLKCGYRGRI